MIEKYHTVKDKSEGYFVDKKSKFFSYSFNVKTKDDVKKILKEIKKIHHKSNHLPYAFRCGILNEDMGFSDDGEPTGSAGKPILFEFERDKLKNTLIIVARYFGGVKLGVGGLVRAFSTAARNAIENNDIIEKNVCRRIRIEFTYDVLKSIELFCLQNKMDIVMQDFGEICVFEILIEHVKSESSIESLKFFKILKLTELDIE